MLLLVHPKDLHEVIPLLIGFLLGFGELCAELLDSLFEMRDFGI